MRRSRAHVPEVNSLKPDEMKVPLVQDSEGWSGEPGYPPQSHEARLFETPPTSTHSPGLATAAPPGKEVKSVGPAPTYKYVGGPTCPASRKRGGEPLTGHRAESSSHLPKEATYPTSRSAAPMFEKTNLPAHC